MNTAETLHVTVEITGITRVVSMDDKVKVDEDAIKSGVVKIEIDTQKNSLRGTFDIVVS